MQATRITGNSNILNGISRKLRIRSTVIIAVHLISHPTHSRDIPDWLQQRHSATIASRRPWWPRQAIDFIGGELVSGNSVFEYGGGGSTLWLEDQHAKVVVVEHDRAWYEQLVSATSEARVLWRAPTKLGYVRSDSAAGYFDDYATSITEFPRNTFDLVIVDGRARVECVRVARQFVRQGGMLLLDDSDRLRYRPVGALLASWPSKSFRGFKSGVLVPATTTVWRRPIGSADSLLGSPSR